MKAVLLVSTFSTLLLLSEGNKEPEPHNETVTAILDNLLVGYDKRVRPNDGNFPITVRPTGCFRRIEIK